MSSLGNNCYINYKNKCNIIGIGEAESIAIGTVELEIFFEHISCVHTFYVIPDSVKLPCSGILGLDFYRNYDCDLSKLGSNPQLSIRINKYLVKLPLFVASSCEEDHITLPARAEVIRKIKFPSATEENLLILNQEISAGIFIARCIISKERPYVRILNLNEENVRIPIKPLEFETLDSYDLIEFNDTNKTHRTEVLKKLSPNFPEFVKDDLNDLCGNYHDIFALPTDKVSANNFYKQKLRIKDDVPIYIKNYRIPQTHKEEIKSQVSDLLEKGIIEPSVSEYNSPVLLVPKKNLPNASEKRWRMVIDFRKVNEKLLSDKFPLPRIDEILDGLGKAKYFSCLDLYSGFHQIELEENSRNVTSFSTDNGSFRFTRLPFGLKVAPNSFQRMMSLAFAGLTPEIAFIYMDDLVVFAQSEKKMIKNLTKIFDTCRKRRLKLNPDKCQFFKHEAVFLGHNCTSDGIFPDKSKFEVIKNYPKPTTAEAVKRFVAFINYYRKFIPNFANYSYFLTRLTRKNVPFIWDENCEKSFNYFKNSLINPKVLKYPDYDKQFCITTDASKIACGAILTQEYNGIHMPVRYASRTFTKGESNKSVIEQELLAIHWALDHFKPYIYGRKFLVRSDHRPLVYLFGMKNPSSKLTRLRLDLEEYDFQVEYIKGSENVGADALSRIEFEDIKKLCKINMVQTRATTRKQANRSQNTKTDKIENRNTTKSNVYEAINLAETRKLPDLRFNFSREIPDCRLIKNAKTLFKFDLTRCFVKANLDINLLLAKLQNKADEVSVDRIKLSLNDEIFGKIGINNFKIAAAKNLRKLMIALTPKIEFIKDEDKKHAILEKFHDNPLYGGHTGIKRMNNKIKSRYTWKNLARDVTKYVKNCINCQKNKASKKTREKLTLTKTAQTAFDIIAIDTIGPLPKSEYGNEYAVTIVCELTKYLIVVPIQNKKAQTVAKAIFENVFLIYGPSRKVLTDCGSEYINEVLRDVLKLLNIEHSTSTPYHHETLGVVERNHRTLNEYLRNYISGNKTDWDGWIKYFMFCYNTTPSTVHNYCPFELVFGKTPVILSFLKDNIDPVYNVDLYYQEIRNRLKIAHQNCQNLVTNMKINNKEIYDKRTNEVDIKENDLVLTDNPSRHKLDPLYKGPYKVKTVENSNCVLLDEKGNEHKIHKNRIKKFNSYFFYKFLI